MTKVKSLTRNVVECCTADSLRVDRDAGVIFGVKVVGRESPNSHGVEGVTATQYTMDALRNALPHYENCKVNLDHPSRDNPHADRASDGRIGKLVNCRVERDGIYGDLHVLKSHPMAERLFEAAERMPDLFGLSHNAMGKGTVKGGVYVIEEIPSVRSVDIVADAGTTKSLFESKETKPMFTLRELFESSIKSNRLGVKSKRALRRLLEDFDKDEDELLEMPAEDAGVEDFPDAEAVKKEPGMAATDGIRATMVAILSDDETDSATKIARLKKLLKIKDEMEGKHEDEKDEDEEMMEADDEMDDGMGEDESDESDEEGKEEEEELEEGHEDDVIDEDIDAFKKTVKKDTKESRKIKQLKNQIMILEAEKSVRKLAEAAGVKLTAEVFEALASLPSDRERRAVINSYKIAKKANYSSPRSRSTLESRSDEIPQDSKTFAQLLRGERVTRN